MDQRKLRLIKPSQDKASEVYGITIPPNISILFKNVFFQVAQSGTSIILTSGTKITINQDVKGYDLESFK
jgi:hypothetical protein